MGWQRRGAKSGRGARGSVDQAFDVVGMSREIVDRRRFNERNYRVWWRAEKRRCRWSCVDRFDRQNRRVIVVEHAVMAVLVMICGVPSEVPMYEQVLMAMVIGLMDMLGRCDRKPPDRECEHHAKYSPPEHYRDPSAITDGRQLKTL